MMIYLSNEKFLEVFGDSGTVYYFTDLGVEALEGYFPETVSFIDRNYCREYYKNSVVSVMVMLIVLCILVIAVSVMVLYSLLSLFLSTVKWKVNLLRGFGLSKLEFSSVLLRMFVLLCLVSLFVCMILSEPLTDLLTSLILNLTDSYFELSVTWEVAGAMLVIYVLLCFLLIASRALTMDRLSIYQQYLRTRPEE